MMLNSTLEEAGPTSPVFFLFGGDGARTAAATAALHRSFGLEKEVWFFLGGYNAFWQNSLVVLGQAILPLQEFSQVLGLDTDFDAAKAGEKQIHLIAKAGCSAKIFRARLAQFDLPVV